MTRTGFETYRRAYRNLLTCASARERAPGACVDGWIRDASALITAQDRARTMMNYYIVNSLRASTEHTEGLCAPQVQVGRAGDEPVR
jgi:hypothetical protein